MENQIKVVLSKKEPLNKHVLWLKPNSLHEASLKIYNNEGWQDLKTINVPEELLNKVGELNDSVKEFDKEIDNFSVIINSFRDDLITETQQRMAVDSSLGNRITSVTTTANNNKTNLNNLETNLNTNLANLRAKDEELETAISNLQKEDAQLTNIINVKQDELMLTVLDNGNIRIGNLQGQTKEFMPATPSGDPMHYAYVNAGAEYNATGADITRIGVFGDAITWKAGYWWLNELGDISNEEMKTIYRYKYTAPSVSQVKSYFSAFRKIRTPIIDVPTRASAIDASYFAHSTNFRTIALSQTQELVLIGTMTSFMSWSQGVKKIINGLDLTYVKTEGAIRDAFYNASSLEEVRLYNLQVSVGLEKSKNLSNASIICMIENEIAGNTITITLHADAYARAMADASIVEALAAHTNVTLASA